MYSYYYEGINLPDAYKRHGIARLIPARIVMWQPFCLANLSAHNGDGDVSVGNEILLLEDMVRILKSLKRDNVMHVLVALDELVWNPVAVQDRIRTMLPMIGATDATFTAPELNSKQFRTSISAFGKAHNPAECCGYDLKTRRCNHECITALPHRHFV